MDPNQQVPPPPAPNPQSLSEEQIRAMRSDLTKASTPAPMQPAAAAPTPAAPAMPGATTVNVPSPNIPAKPIFDADEPSFSAGTTTTAPSSVDELVAQGSGSKKWWMIGGVIGILILGAVGYFVVYPMLTKAPEATTPAPVEPTATTPQTPTKLQHVSVFVNTPDGRVTETLPAAAAQTDVVAALNKQAGAAAAGTTEVAFVDEAGDPAAFNTFLAKLTPGFTAGAGSNTIFADDFTAFIFKDANGSWPGYIATLKTDFAADALRTWFTNLEQAPLAEFFLVAPGTLSTFKDGTVNGKYPDRYVTGKTAGASFGYLMLPEQNKVIISTSFDGLKEALRLMGL